MSATVYLTEGEPSVKLLEDYQGRSVLLLEGDGARVYVKATEGLRDALGLILRALDDDERAEFGEVPSDR